MLYRIERQHVDEHGLVLVERVIDADISGVHPCSSPHRSRPNDILISSTTARLNEPLWTVNLERMKTDAAFRDRVKNAAYRVLKAKLEYFKSGNAAGKCSRYECSVSSHVFLLIIFSKIKV